MHTYFIFWISTSGVVYCFDLFDSFDKKFLSKLKSWLPAMTILCLYGNIVKNCLNLVSSPKLEAFVKSPQWMKISAFGMSFTSILWWKSWVSDITTTRKPFILAYSIINIYKRIFRIDFHKISSRLIFLWENANLKFEEVRMVGY